MTKFFLWVVGEDVNQQLDIAAKFCFNVMMLGVSLASVLCVVGIVFSFGFLVNLFL